MGSAEELAKVAAKCKKVLREYTKCVSRHHDDQCGCDPAAPSKCDFPRLKLVQCQAKYLKLPQAAPLERCSRSVLSQGSFDGRNNCDAEMDATLAAIRRKGARGRFD